MLCVGSLPACVLTDVIRIAVSIVMGQVVASDVEFVAPVKRSIIAAIVIKILRA